jgi:nitroreductase
MTFAETLYSRKSTRSFLKKEVVKEKITAILRAASHAPSGANAQPWQVAVVRGEKRKVLTKAMEARYREHGIGTMDYYYYPLEWHEPYKNRRITCGSQLYGALQIGRKDKKRRIEQWIANYRAFDAPVILFFFLDQAMQIGSFLDYGMFIQSIMLAAVEEGLATCPQAALGQYPDLVKKSLGYSQDSTLVCGMALGYEDKTAPINSYRTSREEVETFTRFFE